MLPIAAIKYIFYSGVLVVSFFFAIRCLFAHDLRREAWRTQIKRRVYISRTGFKRLTIRFGWLSLFISLYVAYFLILDFVDA